MFAGFSAGQWCICECVYAYVHAIEKILSVHMRELEQILHEYTYACNATDTI